MNSAVEAEKTTDRQPLKSWSCRVKHLSENITLKEYFQAFINVSIGRRLQLRQMPLTIAQYIRLRERQDVQATDGSKRLEYSSSFVRQRGSSQIGQMHTIMSFSSEAFKLSYAENFVKRSCAIEMAIVKMTNNSPKASSLHLSLSVHSLTS